jgi:hypothetical protein
MTTQSNFETPETTPTHDSKSGAWIGGLILILIGAYLLVTQFFQASWMGLAFLPGLGLIFVTAALVSQKRGLLIPGGILAGIGAGAILVSGNFFSLTEPVSGGIFMLAFALGWGLISLLSLAIPVGGSRQAMTWPLIPGGIIGLVGVAMLAGEVGLKTLQIAGYAWPVILIAIGAYIILKRRG